MAFCTRFPFVGVLILNTNVEPILLFIDSLLDCVALEVM